MINNQMKEIKRILSDLVGLETTAGNTREIDAGYQYLQRELAWYPFIVRTVTHNYVKSMIWSTERERHTQIILSAHLDVVPGDKSLFTLKEREGEWWGRGVMDMKFALASFIVGLKSLYQQSGSLPSLAIIVTSDEERGGQDGANYIVNHLGYSADVVLIPDGGANWHIVQEAKGVLQLKVKVVGKSSHASKPWEGESAIDALMTKLRTVRNIYPDYKNATDKTTITISTIAGGYQTNQVANIATATLDVRYRSGEDPEKILNNIQDVFDKRNTETIILADSFSCDPNNIHVDSWMKCIRRYQPGKITVSESGASDGRYFASKNMPVIVCQPHGGNTHGDNEHIEINSVLDYTQALINWLRLYLKNSKT